MTRKLTYTDAVRILGVGPHPVVDTAEKLLSIGSDAAGVAGLPGTGGTIATVCALSRKLLDGLGARVRGARGRSRTELLVAAHHVIVLVAFLEIFDEVRDDTRHKLPVIEMVDKLSEAPIPFPGVHLGYDDVLSSLLRFYGSYLTLDHAQRAVDRYQELYRRLEGDCPEFALWAQREERRATDQVVRSGFAELSHLLGELATAGPAAQWPERLGRAHRALLGRPIAETQTAGFAEQGLPDLVIPTLEAAYIEPPFRYAVADADASPSMDGWWGDQRRRDHLGAFVAGCLSHPMTREVPLLVLGHPGSGKSVLTKQIAARLPAEDFLAVRVELRNAPSDAPLQDQIEHATKAATGEHMDWPSLVRAAGDVTPVILLDGFDELLQNSARSHWNYLTDVAKFQQREADQGRQAVVIVTSRTAVSAHAEIPAGTVMVRLEPFGSAEIASWIDTWNQANAGYFSSTGLEPLDPGQVSRFPALAGQPLLLLMLALYDAPANALARASGELGDADLYERLITDFVRRQVLKADAGLSPAELDAAVRVEIAKLSICALGMFNRGTQWLSHEDLEDDLRALLPDHSARRSNARLSESKLLFGRFFFVHRSRETVGPAIRETFEFLHATFGEYLVARMMCEALVHLAVSTGGSAHALSFGQERIDDTLLRSLLSYAVLSDREKVVQFGRELLNGTYAEHAGRVRDVLLRLFARSMHEAGSGAYDGYRPRDAGVPARHAAYSANLLLLAVLIRGEVLVSELFDERPAEQWTSHAYLWKSQLDPSSWFAYTEALIAQRESPGELRIRFGGRPSLDLGWHFDSDVVLSNAPYAVRDLSFAADLDVDVLLSIAEPLAQAPMVLVTHPDGRLVAVSDLFVDLPNAERAKHELLDAITAALSYVSLLPEGSQRKVLHAITRRIRVDGTEWPTDVRARVARDTLRLRAATGLPSDLRDLLEAQAKRG